MAHEKNHDFHIIDPSPWPMLGSMGALVMLIGLVLLISPNAGSMQQPFVFLVGLAVVLYVMFAWWRDVRNEGNGIDHTPVVRIGLRMGFIMFVMSEVMFFSAWFWAFFKFALFPMVDYEMSPEELQAAGIAVEALTTTTSNGPLGIPLQDRVTTFDPWDLPLINTLILLLSGCTVTWAHHELIEGGQGEKRQNLIMGLLLTCLLGGIFTAFQAYEYTHATFAFDGNVYGAVFFMATGFHGFHVIVGTIFLFVCLLRSRAGDFTAERHIGFEAAAWYWHFVDVVWLFLFAAVYIWAQ
ncbi:MAG: cytochrome c oxidase subunit 3 [Pseudomonadota bacterium]